FYEQGRPISAICAAPTIFGHRGYLKGKEACCFPGLEDQLAGAKVSMEAAVIDGNITTGRGMGAAIAFGCAIIERYQGKEAAAQMAAKVVSRS
ncbi:MAG: DJ-1/PfpI family protein, partial [Lachnospiraceae bacterium]|nr:DJ-1/PfpI family protein [Lachnospiraceae bacterium]